MACRRSWRTAGPTGTSGNYPAVPTGAACGVALGMDFPLPGVAAFPQSRRFTSSGRGGWSAREGCENALQDAGWARRATWYGDVYRDDVRDAAAAGVAFAK